MQLASSSPIYDHTFPIFDSRKYAIYPPSNHRVDTIFLEMSVVEQRRYHIEHGYVERREESYCFLCDC